MIATLALLLAAQAGDVPLPAWGTTPDAVQAAVPGAMEVAPHDGDEVFGADPRFDTQSMFGDQPVRVSYFFDTGNRLSLVKILPTGDTADQCMALRDAALERFGKPAHEEDKSAPGLPVTIHRIVWSDKAADRAVMFANMVPSVDPGGRSFCHIILQPYGADGEPGARKP